MGVVGGEVPGARIGCGQNKDFIIGGVVYYKMSKKGIKVETDK